ncbi:MULTISPECIES: 2-hydroxychromene-2-carboxylate isomerase [Paraburkholderia]|jgi:2-hydroxychromene-2-carboxylate isomerase|uniref:2-hydroxychromene-2-carboxylate isomerase n=2 Tax=Paraburkholderia TaxID=1822464 RepID=A0AB73IHK7_9BURK|nr:MULTISPECIES: 2-hydroxychromene-2-carboxylate isomerase [Paraburkholderia]MDP9649196.1 2-hydroxychromene-2-carboxylate isomerase [Paraburkholderia caledonica]MDR7005537.1 2-hydroxychromene-2-carboxylate isomerase [Paraburkholderia strydomiana]TCF98216.1 disulfide bond formation protein DsbA [Paraburkholderia strydomiana]CAH2901411.1 MAG: 2-hydroxychromene-2-carboxylate isomerase family protein [uncultured Paraburkholderia sp.]CAH2933839.1 MAG: 2-hydroxychromene-2-carboxylate isomerase famil
MDHIAASAATPARRIEFWFDFGSNYSYLSVMRIEAEAAARGVSVDWRPFLLGPIFRALGFDNSPFVLQKEKGAYVWKDMERQCRKYGIALTRPSVFPRAALLALRVALLGAEREWIAAYCREIMQQNFVHDRDIGSIEVVSEALAKLGLPAQQIVAEAQSDANKLRLREQTEAAASKGIFGAPTFFVGDEMFWGNDRLEDALDFCYSSPR